MTLLRETAGPSQHPSRTTEMEHEDTAHEETRDINNVGVDEDHLKTPARLSLELFRHQVLGTLRRIEVQHGQAVTDAIEHFGLSWGLPAQAV